jgi:flagellar biosynthesis chaperone FliJ
MAKSKFSILKFIKEKEIEREQTKAMRLNNFIANLKSNIKEQQEKMINNKYPTSGNFSKITIFQEFQSSFRRTILELSQEKEIKEKEYQGIINNLKNLNIEFEKFKYMDDIENKKILHELKKKEVKLMDELSQITLAYRKQT